MISNIYNSMFGVSSAPAKPAAPETPSKDGCEFHNDMSNRQEVKFSEEAPKWRIVSRGLNIEATCATESCEAYNKRVWTVVELKNEDGFGQINFIRRICRVVCPICKQHTPEDTVYGVGFYDCKYSFDGQISSDKGSDQKREGYDQSNHRRPLTARVEKGFVKYEGTNEIQFWKFLDVQVDPLD